MRATQHKLLHLFTAIIVMTLGPAAFGQQMVSTPAERSAPEPATEEKIAPEPAKKSPETSSSPTSEEPAAAKPAKKATASSAAREESAEAEQRVKPLSKRGTEAALKEKENQWEAALVAHDVKLIESLVASDFAGVNSTGKFVNKAAMLAEVKKDKDRYKSAKNDKLTVHVYGPDIAVVTGSARARGTTPAGQAFDRTYHYTDTWVQRNGMWQCVASQDSLVTGK